ncbi:MAG TPA: YqhA family protein, partial [Beijerinckiaceae bacterium]|nr:YqhA family protein [Beijerinckiaceae bacterium]
MLVAAAGALIGALLMFWEGGGKLAGALWALLVANDDAKSLGGAVMGATDALLFGVVLLVFAFAITFGFVFDLPADARERL